jgi:diguanylate cyclase (GGDEF)-like protein
LLFAAIELAERCGYTALRLEARLQHARLAAGQGRPEESMQMAERLLHDNDAAKGPRLERRTLQHLYVTCKQQGQVDAALHFLERLLQTEWRAMRRAQAVQTQVLLIRQEVQHAMARAAHAHAHAQAAQERAQGLEQEQLRLRERLARTEPAAMEDLLTRLANRRHAEHALPLLMARTELEPLALALLDIDHFKRVNDQFGHAVGDRVLRDFGALLRQQLRGADLLARWGGEEFVVVLTGEGARRAAQIMDRLKRAVENHPWHRLSEGLALTTSVGLTLQHPSETPPPWAQVVLRADQALYRAKASGRNQVCSA